jgi:Family of unknown function (DUF6492)
VTASVAFVTPSYRLDRDRCALLSRSLEVCAPSVEHWIVVDRGDLPSFRSLQDGRTTVVAKEEVLPPWVRRLDTLKVGLRSNAWVQARGLPIRGWLLQQLVKLAVAEQLSADLLVYADSDVVLLRPFSVSSLVDTEGRVRLYAREDCVDAALPDHVRWHRSAEKLLGIEPADLPMPDFISSLVPWKRENAVALLEHIERTTGKHWLRALASAWHVSEYTLYGRFALDVLGTSGGQFASSAPLCSDYYKRVPLTVPELKTLLDRVGADEIAVSITSKAGMDPEQYVDVLERRWADLGQREAGADAQPRYGRSGSGRAGVGEGAAGRPLGRPIRERMRAMPARMGREDSATPPGHVFHTVRHGITWAILVMLALMMVLVDLGMD